MDCFMMVKMISKLALFALTLPCLANTWPSKPIHLIVPYTAGGTIDTIARNLGQKLTASLKQTVIVENKVGAGGLIGADVVAKAPADGHTLLITTNGLAIASALYKKTPFDAKKDLVPITELMSTYMTFAVGPRLQANNFKEFLALAKSKPDELNYGSTGIGSAPHLVMEILKANAKIKITHIPYSGDAPMNQALIAGSIDAVITPIFGAYENMKAGKLRILAISDNKRSDLLPNVPTIAESGLNGFEYLGWVGVFAPYGVDAEIIKKLQSEFSKVLVNPEIKEKMTNWGYEGVGSATEVFKNKYNEDLIKYSKIIKEINIEQD
jgi:tripartite-type tricarboxylate transporter receptor subunit TctC